MMASNCSKVSVRFITFILFFCLSIGQVNLRGIIRSRRQVCLDGAYEHEGRACCLCPAGQHLQDHCKSSQDDTTCMLCQSGTFNSHPNSLTSCRPCTSCSHPNANLEVAEPCTAARDTKCRCKKDHYCSSNTESCKICQPCTVCSSPNIMKEECTATNDTVCQPEGSHTATVVTVTIAVIFLVAVAAAASFFCWRKRQAARTRQTSDPNKANGNGADDVMPFLSVKNVVLQSLLPQIAEELGWKDMEHLAIKTGINLSAIDACVQDYPHDSQERTLRLLIKWVEQQGRNAPQRLVELLNGSGKKNKAEKIRDLFPKHKTEG